MPLQKRPQLALGLLRKGAKAKVTISVDPRLMNCLKEVVQTLKKSQRMVHFHLKMPKQKRSELTPGSLATLVSGNSVLDDEYLVSNNASLGRGERLAPSKRKAITVNMDSNVSSKLSKGNRSNLIPDALPLKLGGNESCSKRIRYLLLNDSKWYQF